MAAMENDRLLTPEEAARRLGVSTKTLSRWANAEEVTFIKTLGGHRRYYESVVRKLLKSA